MREMGWKHRRRNQYAKYSLPSGKSARNDLSR
jgi:hypothetical protein